MKIISIKTHRFLDYATVAVFALLPSLFMFSGLPAYLCYFLATVHLLMTILTYPPLGMFKVVPLKLHKLVETVVGPALLACPWILGFSADVMARNIFMVMGIVLILVVFLSSYDADGAA